MFYKEPDISHIIYVEYSKMRSYMMMIYNISFHSLCSNSKWSKKTCCGFGCFAYGLGK